MSQWKIIDDHVDSYGNRVVEASRNGWILSVTIPQGDFLSLLDRASAELFHRNKVAGKKSIRLGQGSDQDILNQFISWANKTVEGTDDLTENPENSDTLINQCQKLWTVYYNDPSEKSLKKVFDHLERMKKSKNKKVKKEYRQCVKVADRDKERIGL